MNKTLLFTQNEENRFRFEKKKRMKNAVYVVVVFDDVVVVVVVVAVVFFHVSNLSCLLFSKLC